MIQQIFLEEKNKHTSEQITMSDYKDEQGETAAQRREIKAGEVSRSKDWKGWQRLVFLEDGDNNVKNSVVVWILYTVKHS